MKLFYRFTAVMLCAAMLLMAGCAQSAGEPETTAAVTNATEATQGTDAPTEQNADAASLNSLRQAMVGTPQVFAVAYFGYHASMDDQPPVNPFEVMREQMPQLCADLPFLLEIPEERIIGESGDLFCIVPLDADATVAVSKGIWDEGNEEYIYEDSLYYSESGEPILLFCNDAGWEPDTQVYITGPSGEVIWYPQTDSNLCAMPLRNDNWDDLFYDFSPYREILIAELSSMAGEWTVPTEEMLAGTTWQWEGWLKDGREVSYQVTFDEKTLSVRWNDGIDFEDHEFPDAAWELTYEEGYAVLSIDFREMAGVLRYNVMYHEAVEYMYFGMDVVQQELPIGWEPLYRYLLLPAAPEPVEMLGEWELAWTEVEGYREEIEPGAENISVFLNDDNGFRITLTDWEFPQKSFYNKELGIYEGELYSGCGNDQWMCYIGYMGPNDIIHSLTLTQDGTLLMQMYWEVDNGVPMVAYKGYRRVE